MSTKREPMMSDHDCEVVTFSGFVPQDQLHRMALFALPADYKECTKHMRRVRDFYEDLITTGKLRVVEEVEYSRIAIHMVGPHAYRCGGCGKSYRIAGDRIDGSDEYYEWSFCPGCGNPIKR